MCVGAPVGTPRHTLMATPPSLNGRLSAKPRADTPRRSHHELPAHIAFEREAELQLARLERGAQCAARKGGVVGVLNALARC